MLKLYPCALLTGLLLITGLAPTFAQGRKKPMRVFIFAGQSNMVGSDSKVSEIESFPPFRGLDRPQPRVLFSYCIGRETKRRSEGWQPLAPVDGLVGPELSFARTVTRRTDARLAIIKIAAGGTHLGGDWNPDRAQGFALYPLALSHVRQALAELDRRRLPWRLEGFVWHQGENDMFEEDYRKHYGRNLARFIACWRRDLKAPQLPFFIGELCTKTIWGMDQRPRMYAISQGQKEVCRSDPLAYYVPTSHIGVKIGAEVGLHYHYGTLGQLQHGESHARAYLRHIEQEAPPARKLRKWPYRRGRRLKLFILAGHRNMEGERAFVEELRGTPQAALARDQAQIAYRYEVGGGFAVSAGWEPLGPAGPYQTFGPELSFGRALQRKLRGRVVLAKFTHGGSQIIDWTPEGSAAKDRNLYPEFLTFIRESVRSLRKRGHGVELAGIFYHVGENDMSFGPYRRAAPERLEALIRQSRKDLGLPRLPWFVSQQRPTAHPNLDGIDVTRKIRELAERDPFTVHVEAHELLPPEERIVLRTGGIVRLGEILARAYLARR
jgi:hypothetical protein